MAKKSAAVKPIAQKVPELQILGRWEKTHWEIVSTSAMGCCKRQDKVLVEHLLTFSIVLLACLPWNTHGIKCRIICSCGKLRSGFGHTYTHHGNKWENFCAVIISTVLCFFSSTCTTVATPSSDLYHFLHLSRNTKPHNQHKMLKSSTV